MVCAAGKKAPLTPTPEQLQIEVDRIKEEPSAESVVTLTATSAAKASGFEPEPVDGGTTAEPFVRWLVAQTAMKRVGQFGDLAKSAKSHLRFPKAGDPDDIRKHISALSADSDTLEALDDAGREWARL